MVDHSIWREKFKVTHYFVNPNGLASIQGMSYYLQETAVNHANSRSLGYQDLIKNNTAWVLTRQFIKLYKIPELDQKITVESWVDSTTESLSVRDFHILDKEGNILVIARTSWMLLDLKKRRPVPIPDDFHTRIPHHPGRIREDLPLGKLPLAEESAEGKKLPYKVVYSDLDVNMHVNNIHYLKWVLDGFSLEFRNDHRLKTIECNYLSEALYGDELIRITSPDNANDHSFLTIIKKNKNNRVILTSRTKWVPA